MKRLRRCLRDSQSPASDIQLRGNLDGLHSIRVSTQFDCSAERQPVALQGCPARHFRREIKVAANWLQRFARKCVQWTTEGGETMDTFIVTLSVLGVVVLLTAWLPMVLKRLPLSLPILCLIIGMLLAWSPYPLLPSFNPLENRGFTERMTEVVVIIALMGAGLKIDRPIGLARWRTTWRLLGIAMPLTIVAIAGLGYYILDLDMASALPPHHICPGRRGTKEVESGSTSILPQSTALPRQVVRDVR